MIQHARKSKQFVTIWSRSEADLIPGRFRHIITGVMPAVYILMAGFGLSSFFFPLQTFLTVIGVNYSYLWSSSIGLFSLLSLIGLIFQMRLELYSSLVLTILLIIYPCYVLVLIFGDPVHGGITHVNSFFAASIYMIMPAWRVVDISVEIRRSRRRQLYAASIRGKHDSANHSQSRGK